MVTKKFLQQMIGLTITVLLLAGCGGALPEPTTVPTNPPQPPTATPIPPTATPQPPADSTAASGLPREIPPEFQPIMQALVLTGVPPVLPPEFPVDEGLPPIHPYLYTMDSGEYELSLDYGADCQGAGACHYGSLTGKKVDSDVPVGTRTFPFEAERAQPVTLASGIEGYFIEAVCGANCNDATRPCCSHERQGRGFLRMRVTHLTCLLRCGRILPGRMTKDENRRPYLAGEGRRKTWSFQRKQKRSLQNRKDLAPGNTLPENFDPLEEFWGFWDTHSSADYEGFMETVEVDIDLSSAA